MVGAHAGGFNTGTFGVSMLGNYDIANPSEAMIERSPSGRLEVRAVRRRPARHHDAVSGGGGTSKYAAGSPVTLPTIFAHRDVGMTVCPGQYGYSRMGDIRARVAAKIAAAGGPPPPQTVLRNSNTDGSPEWQTLRGDRGDRAIACDWNGDGKDTIAIFRRGEWILFDSNANDAKPVADFWFGDPGDVPLCGDWDGDGKASVGVWRAGWFFLRNPNTTGPAQGPSRSATRTPSPSSATGTATRSTPSASTRATSSTGPTATCVRWLTGTSPSGTPVTAS